MGQPARIVRTVAGSVLLVTGLVTAAGVAIGGATAGATSHAGVRTAVRTHAGARSRHPDETVAATSDGSLAMWAWNWTSSADLVHFAVDHGVSTVFAYVAPGFTDPAYVPPGWSEPEWPLITSLVTDAAAAGITVYAMDGDPSWVTHPSVAVAWAAEALGTGLFSGLHVELEPWGLSTWTTDRTATIAAFVTCLAQIHAVTDSYGVPDEISIPWWLYQYSASTGAPLDVVAMENADAVTIVTYFNSVGEIESYGATEIADAQSLGLSFRLAALCDETSPSWLTFYGDTVGVFDDALIQVNTDMSGTTGYMGIAVEDYSGWAAMGDLPG